MQTTLRASSPARSRRAVAFCCDDRYLPYASFAADQLARISPDRDFDILICTSDPLNLPTVLCDQDVRLCRIDTGDTFAGLHLAERFTQSVYLRLALPHALAAEYDRIVYLDCDVSIEGGDFSALLGLDLRGHAIGAVRDNIQWRWPTRKPRQFKVFGWPTARYFNSGVMLIDCAAYVGADIVARCIALGRAERDRLIGHDQTLLNCVLRGDWAELSPLWNWQITPKSALFEAMGNPHVVHFIRATKPWADPDGDLAPRFAGEMGRFLATHFPDHPVVQAGAGPLAQPAKLRSMMLRHLVAQPRIDRYLARFPTDLTVLS